MPPALISTTRSHLVRLSALVLALVAATPPPRGVAAEPPAARFLLEWGTRGQGPGQFDFPIGIAVGSRGEILVTDFYNARVQRFSPEGKTLSTLKVFPNPGGIALDRDGNIYLSHFPAMRQKETPKPDRVSVSSPKGDLLRQWGKTGKGDGEFDYPGGIAIGREGRVYVADQTNRRVQVFDAQGKFLFKWGEYGTKPGQFGGNSNPKARTGGPQFIAVDREGKVYTTEGSMRRVQVFTAEGEFVSAWGSDEDRPGGFGGGFQGGKGGLQGPVGICFDGRGLVWVSAVSGRVQRFTTEGKYLGGLAGDQDGSPGELVAPHGVAADGRGHLYVVDSYNHRVLKFAITP